MTHSTFVFFLKNLLLSYYFWDKTSYWCIHYVPPLFCYQRF